MTGIVTGIFFQNLKSLFLKKFWLAGYTLIKQILNFKLFRTSNLNKFLLVFSDPGNVRSKLNYTTRSANVIAIALKHKIFTNETCH